MERRLRVLEPRSLTVEQARTISKKLADCPAAVDIVHDGGGGATQAFRNKLARAFREGGWRVAG